MAVWAVLGGLARSAAGGLAARGAAAGATQAGASGGMRTAASSVGRTAARVGVMSAMSNGSGGSNRSASVSGSQQWHSFTGLSGNAKSTNHISHQTPASTPPSGPMGMGSHREPGPLSSVLDPDGFSGAPRTGLEHPGFSSQPVPLPGKANTLNSGRRMTEFMPTSSADPISKYNIGTGVNWGGSAGGEPPQFAPGASGRPQ